MKVDYVSYDNLDLLEEGFRSGILETNDITKDFGMNFSLLLSHIKITFIVDEISILEALIMKKFCNGNMIDLDTSFDDNLIDKNNFPSTYRVVQSMFILNGTITDDNDITVKPDALFFPAKCVVKKVLVSFSGQDILSVIGSIIRTGECFFIKLYNLMKENSDKTKDELIQQLLIQSFVVKFYEYMSFKNEYIDVLTDSVLDFRYLEPMKNSNNLIQPSHVNSIYGMINVLDSTPEIYQSSLENIINNKKTISELDDQDFVMDGTDIFFSCSTSFYTFLELFLYFPIGTVLEYTDIKILYSSDNIIIPAELDHYTTRLLSIIQKIDNDKNEKATSKDNVKLIDKFNLILLNTKTQYTLKFNMSSISDLILTLENSINNDCYGSKDNYISKEILKMIEKIKLFSQVVFNTLSK